MHRLVMIPVVLALLAGVAWADDSEAVKQELMAKAAEVMARAEQHVTNVEMVREKIRRQLVQALTERDAEKVQDLKQRLEATEGRQRKALTALERIRVATHILEKSDRVEELRKAQQELAVAVEVLEAMRAQQSHKVQPATKRAVVMRRAYVDADEATKAALEAQLRAKARQAQAARSHIQLQEAQKAADEMRRRAAELSRRSDELKRARAQIETEMRRIAPAPKAQSKKVDRRRKAPESPRQGQRDGERMKLHHMHQAARHLREAGMGDVAERVMHRAAELESRLRHEAMARELHTVLREMRREIHALRDEVKALRQSMK